MATATIYTGSAFPTDTPGNLSATYLAAKQGVLEVASSEEMGFLLLTYGSGSKWWPVLDEEGNPVRFSVAGTSKDPAEAAVRGKLRRVFPIASPGYFLLWRWSSTGSASGAFLSDAVNSGAAGANAGLVSLGAPLAASATAVHAALAGTAAVDYPGPFTNPDVPRNVTGVFATSYDGGNITITGTDQFDQPQTETLTAVANSTVAGTKIFKTVTAARRSTVGANGATASLGRGTKLGMKNVFTTAVIIVDGAVEAPASADYTNFGFVPTTAADGAHVYQVLGAK